METVSGSGARICEDQEAIALAAKAVQKVVHDHINTSPLHVNLLQALCFLAENSTEAGKPPWPPEIIAKTMPRFTDQTGGWTNSEKDARMRVSAHFGKLDVALKDNTGPAGILRKRLEEMGCRWLPCIYRWDPTLQSTEDRPRGGRGNKALFGIKFFENPSFASDHGDSREKSAETALEQDTGVNGEQRVDGAARATDGPEDTGRETKRAPGRRPDDVLALDYYTEDLSIPERLRWVPANGLLMKSRAARAVAVLVTLTGIAFINLGLVLLLILMAGVNDTPTILKTLLSVTFIGFLVHVLFGWWHALTENGVARAPGLFQSWSSPYGDNVLEIRRQSATSSATLFMVRYVADCSVCGEESGRGSVRLGSGRLEFFGRIVGRCRHAPNEHVWSFDHIRRRGKPLR